MGRKNKIVKSTSGNSKLRAVTIDVIGHVFKGKGISKSEVKETGLPCILYGELYTKYNYYIEKTLSFCDIKTAEQSIKIQRGDVLFAGSGETAEEIGKCAVYLGNEDAYAGGDIIILRPKKCDSLYLSYLLNSEPIIKQKSILSQGNSVVHIYPKDIANLKINLPDFTIQQKIAEIIYKWDTAIETLEQLIAKKERYKKGLMQKLLTGKVRFKEFKEEKWKHVKLGFICDKILDGTHQTPAYVENGIPFYSVESVTKLDFKNTKFISEADHLEMSKRCKLKKGDILMTRIGSIGDTVLVDWDVNASIYVSLALLRTKTNLFDENFVFQYTKSSTFKKETIKRSLLWAAPQKINLGDIQDIPMYVPINKKEQKKIAAVLSVADEEIQTLKLRLKDCQQQKKGLMQQLLTGKIRVK